MDRWSYFLVRLFRMMPHTWDFDRHLDRCAFMAIFYDERLTIAKVMGISPLSETCDHPEIWPEDGATMH